MRTFPWWKTWRNSVNFSDCYKAQTLETKRQINTKKKIYLLLGLDYMEHPAHSNIDFSCFFAVFLLPTFTNCTSTLENHVQQCDLCGVKTTSKLITFWIFIPAMFLPFLRNYILWPVMSLGTPLMSRLHPICLICAVLVPSTSSICAVLFLMCVYAHGHGVEIYRAEWHHISPKPYLHWPYSMRSFYCP